MDWGTPGAEKLERAETVLVLEFSSERKEDGVEGELPWFGFCETGNECRCWKDTLLIAIEVFTLDKTSC